MSLILGIDDAGRGPLIGPMILSGVLIEKNREEALRKHGIKDSKLMEHSERMRLEKIIKENSVAFEVVKVTPGEIDEAVLGINLNNLEAMKMAEVVNKINIQKRHKEKIKVVIDCPSTNIMAWKTKLMKFIEHSANLEIHCEHKADYNHISVGAASILAKCVREEEIAKLRKKYKDYGNIGSGYPADPVTKEFLLKNGKKLKDSGIFRKTWATWKDLFPSGKGQAILSEFKGSE